MDLKLKDKLALVSGSAKGIGLAIIAKALAGEGARVIVNGRKDSSVEKALATIHGSVAGAQVEGFTADLATASVPKRLAGTTLRRIYSSTTWGSTSRSLSRKLPMTIGGAFSRSMS
jgi:NAD(P)-dependent dehydrogenase (short-subunit alcohol dehydrogenase family)